MYRASLGMRAGVSGCGFREGAAQPTEEVLYSVSVPRPGICAFDT
jgi:hypothetical protein